MSKENTMVKNLLNSQKKGNYFVIDTSTMNVNEISKTKDKIRKTFTNHKHKFPGVVMKTKQVGSKFFVVLANPGAKIKTDADIVNDILGSKVISRSTKSKYTTIPEDHITKLLSNKNVIVNFTTDHDLIKTRLRYYNWGVRNNTKVSTNIIDSNKIKISLRK